MTEREWLVATDTGSMLEFLGNRGCHRKLRLFATACCRRIWHLFHHDDSVGSIEVAERFAEGRATTEELRAADELAMWAGDDASWHSMQEATAAWAAASAVRAECIDAARGAVYEVGAVYADDEAKREEERLVQCHLLRDIIGNPFRRVTLDAAWLTSTVTRLAQAAYDERSLPSGTLDPDRLSMLADALEDSGCADEPVLSHLRSPGPHVRGCHIVDLLLGRS